MNIITFYQANRTPCSRIKIAVCQYFGKKREEKKKKEKGFAAKVYEEESILMRYFAYAMFITFFPFSLHH